MIIVVIISVCRIAIYVMSNNINKAFLSQASGDSDYMMNN
jgi:hypothetical protein